MSNDFPIFPPDFFLGAATAAYQIEGAVRQDGRGESIWDRFSHTPGKTYQGQTGDVASDHYHRWREDVGLMAGLGLNAYRFSIAWPRILPLGGGTVNPAGLDFYDRLVDSLLEQGIEPFVTLYHWDLPQALEDAGGWPERSVTDLFADYAALVARRLGDRVRHWMTFNEPWVFAFVGYYEGRHAPGRTDLRAALQAAHHSLLAHGKGVDAIRANSRLEPRVGIALNLNHVEPGGDREADLEAAQRFDGWLNRWFLDPLFRGEYPADMLEFWGERAPEMEPDDLAGLPQRLDFLGVNNYFRSVVGSGSKPPINVETHRPKGTYTEMDWEVYPDELYQLLTRVHRDYGPQSIYITENGAAFPDVLAPGGIVDDPQRIDYLHDHLFAAQRALEEGVPLHGYFCWTLMDNFEWAHGFSKRFGLIYVDYATQARFVKASGHWYRRMIEAQS
ncbi:MAG: GH1 family beta-glucosidase [Anaerolineae bacterium]|jgi:beta-glucosidase